MRQLLDNTVHAVAQVEESDKRKTGAALHDLCMCIYTDIHITHTLN